MQLKGRVVKITLLYCLEAVGSIIHCHRLYPRTDYETFVLLLWNVPAFKCDPSDV